MVRVDLDVLVRNVLLGEGDPDSLHEGTEPPAVELEGVWGGVGGGEERGGAGGRALEGGVDGGRFGGGGHGALVLNLDGEGSIAGEADERGASSDGRGESKLWELG